MPKINSEHTEIFWARVDVVIQAILSNDRYLQSKRNGELTREVMQKIGCEERQAQIYIGEAKREIRKMTKANRDNHYKRVILGLNWVLGTTKSAKEKKLFLETMKYYAKVTGVEIDKVEHSGSISLKNLDTSKLTDEQIQQLKQMIRAKQSEESIINYLTGLKVI